MVLAFENSKRISEEVKKPKALGDIRGVSYIYPILWRFGLIRVPESTHRFREGEYPRTTTAPRTGLCPLFPAAFVRLYVLFPGRR